MMSTGEPYIEVKNVTMRYGDRTILDNVSFTVNKGESLALIGGSGSGKSTLLRVMSGLAEPTEGQVLYEGTDLIKASTEERREILKRIGILFQSSGLLASMTLAENIALPLETYTSLNANQIMKLVRMKLGALGLKDYDDFLPSEISGGMKKRAGLARALALDPDILFFDEPSAGLDPSTSAALDHLIKELNSILGVTMIVVTHELPSIFEIAQRVIMLDKTEHGIIAQGTVEELKDSDDKRVADFFNRVPAEY